jgi:hypothetical protein
MYFFSFPVSLHVFGTGKDIFALVAFCFLLFAVYVGTTCSWGALPWLAFWPPPPRMTGWPPVRRLAGPVRGQQNKNSGHNIEFISQMHLSTRQGREGRRSRERQRRLHRGLGWRKTESQALPIMQMQIHRRVKHPLRCQIHGGILEKRENIQNGKQIKCHMFGGLIFRSPHYKWQNYEAQRLSNFLTIFILSVCNK